VELVAPQNAGWRMMRGMVCPNGVITCLFLSITLTAAKGNCQSHPKIKWARWRSGPS